jgi:hypothetical protein
MSLEITLYPKKSTKKRLMNFLEKNGFHKTGHIFKSMETDDVLYFHWFKYKDCTSFTGVEATLYKIGKKEQKKNKSSKWILHTRTLSSASRADKKKQNKLIKKAKKQFKGNFTNDWYGDNTYTDIKDYPKLTAPERCLQLFYSNFTDKISKLRFSLNDYRSSFESNIKKADDENFKNFLMSTNPSNVFFNALIPFLVSLIEYSFKEVFLILLKYEAIQNNQIKNESFKLNTQDILDIQKKQLNLENIIAGKISFQNLQQINKSYQEYLNIDINSIISKEQEFNKTTIRLNTKINDIIDLRHSMIHHFGYDNVIDKEEYEELLDIVELFIKVFIEWIEKENNWDIKGLY